MSIKQEEHGSWSASAGGDVVTRAKRVSSGRLYVKPINDPKVFCFIETVFFFLYKGIGAHSHQQHSQYILQQSISEDSLQDEPLHGR